MLLLDGAPGTGKSLTAEASAASEGAVLVLDEADSLLRSREGDAARLEVTQVNTLLTEIERFEGVAVLTTNHAAAQQRSGAGPARGAVGFATARPARPVASLDSVRAA